MKEALFVNLGDINDCLISTSLIKELKRDQYEITVLVKDKFSAEPFRYNPRIKNILLINKLPNNFSDIEFDTLFNFHPNFDKNTLNVNYRTALGFNFSYNSFKFEKVLYCDEKVNKNIFQIYYSLMGRTWSGQGFDFNYNPKNKSGKNRVGIAVSNIKLRDYVMSELKLNDDLRLWHIPYRKDFFKKCNEINRCEFIITDDFCSLNIALALRKEAFFLQKYQFNFRIEMFGKGRFFKIPRHLL